MAQFRTFDYGEAVGAGQNLAQNQFRLGEMGRAVDVRSMQEEAMRSPQGKEQFQQKYPIEAGQADAAARAAQLEKAKKDIDFVGNIAAGMNPDNYLQSLQQIKDAGADISDAPAVYDPNWIQSKLQKAQGYKGQLDLELGRLKQKSSASSRYKFGQVTRGGELTALDTEQDKMVVFTPPGGEKNLIDRPYLSQTYVTPEGEKRQRTGPRGTFPTQMQDVPTELSAPAKTRIEQRGAKAVIDRADKLVDKLWTAEGNLASRSMQLAELKGKELTQSDPDVAQYISLRAGFLAPIIRALGEKGTLAEGDTARAIKLWPDFFDSKEVAKGKLRQINKIFDGVMTGKYNSMDEIEAAAKPGDTSTGIKFKGFK